MHIEYTRIIDLTLKLHDNMAVYPGDPPVNIRPKIPDSVIFDKVLESKEQEIQNEILEIEKQIKPLSKVME